MRDSGAEFERSMSLTSMQKHRHRDNGNVSHTQCINEYATQFRFADPVTYKVNQTHNSLPYKIIY